MMANRRGVSWRLLLLVGLWYCLAGVQPVLASGFYTPEIGARAVGRGGAVIAGVDDLTAIYINPAGLVRVRGYNANFSVNFDVFHTSYQRSPIEPKVHNQNPVDVIPFAGLSFDFGLERFTFALGFFGPYGVAEKYDETGPQRYEAIEIRRSQVYYMIGAGWAPLDWLRLGAAFGIGEFAEDDTYAFTPFEDDLPAHDVIANARIRQMGIPMYAVGILLGPFHGCEFGFSYQPATDVTLRGEIEAQLPDLYAAVAGGEIYTDQITVGLKFPHILRFGVRQWITPQLDLEANAVWTGWSRLATQDIDFEKEELMEDYVVETGWEDTWDFRLGGGYEAFPSLVLRAGGWYDQSATQMNYLAPGLIETPRWSIGFGFGYYWRGMTLDFAFSHIWMEDIEVTEEDLREMEVGDPRGRYFGSYDMFVLGVNFNFGDIATAFRR